MRVNARVDLWCDFWQSHQTPTAGLHHLLSSSLFLHSFLASHLSGQRIYQVELSTDQSGSTGAEGKLSPIPQIKGPLQ